MTPDQTGHTIFLGLLAFATLAWFWLNHRRTPGRGLQSLMGWALLFVGILAAAGLWQDVRGGLDQRQAVFSGDGRIEIPRGFDGHYYVTLEVNGSPTRFVVDTGASGMVLTKIAAEEAGLHPDDLAFYDMAQTANGTVKTAPVTLDSVSLGPFMDRGVRAYVNDGQMMDSLLGMDYLSRFDRLEISGGRMVLER
ncbi:retropepsin-like aspartic protease family protein [Sagittula stellata]|uniref:Peptidase A2 domain-containing protein n=1 Tax=Sagittula stellata (strain ATCC 700073 / DSM 11524 / E-37) TaxID=388399 RepID=A3JZ60_SAGS3|nr:TIGR02281 family clan AA aspartic protease [Sagittula stellata]EBA09763.1 hypothetical protein SSE37_08143 [Sagittula stellata E-37]